MSLNVYEKSINDVAPFWGRKKLLPTWFEQVASRRTLFIHL